MIDLIAFLLFNIANFVVIDTLTGSVTVARLVAGVIFFTLVALMCVLRSIVRYKKAYDLNASVNYVKDLEAIATVINAHRNVEMHNRKQQASPIFTDVIAPDLGAGISRSSNGRFVIRKKSPKK